MTDRIATFYRTAGLVGKAMDLQSSYARTQQQTSSGLKSENFVGIALDSGRMLDFQSEAAKANGQVAALKSAQARVESIQNVTSNIGGLLDTINNQLTAALDGSRTAAGAVVLGNQATTWKNEIAGLLNTKYAGNYLFGGNVQDSPPVDLTDPAYTPTLAPTTPDTDYYQGDSVVQTVRVSSGLVLSYGVTADSAAFEKIFRALSLVEANPGNLATLNNAFTLIKNASEGVADISSILASKNDLLNKEMDSQAATVELLNSAVSDLRDVDIAEASIRLTSIETQLQASYSTLTTLLKLNLVDYLR